MRYGWLIQDAATRRYVRFDDVSPGGLFSVVWVDDPADAEHFPTWKIARQHFEFIDDPILRNHFLVERTFHDAPARDADADEHIPTAAEIDANAKELARRINLRMKATAHLAVETAALREKVPA